VPETLAPESVTAQLERILNSPPLESSPSLCRFLRYVVQETLAGRGGQLKEYSLGAEVFDRGDQFDPRMDPIVRVQARNLRARLAQYYAAAGASDPVLIDLPKRTYVPVFQSRAAAVADAASLALPEAGTPSNAVAMPNAVAEADALTQVDVLPEPELAPVHTAPQHKRTSTVVTAAVLITFAGVATVWQLRPHDEGRQVHQPNPQAQDLYIRGRYIMDRQTEPALRESIHCFEQAIAGDPNFAAAYAGIADAYNVLAQYGYLPPAEGMQKARAAADRAISLDPLSAEGHVSLAAIIEAYDWNWTAAEREYRRALQLNPWLPAAHLWYGMFLRDQGRIDEAMPELRRAAQMEPFSVLTSLNLAQGLMAEGNYRGAEEEARHAAERAPDLVTAHIMLAQAHRAQAQNADSEAALERASQAAGDNPHGVAMLARVYGRIGRRDESLRLLRRLEDLAKQRYVSPYDMGIVLLALGDEDGALTQLNEAYRQRSSGLIFLREARFKGLQRAPEFHSLVEKMRFAG
jgi:tetratricopeptide (TPR) repeat protein